SQVTVPVPATVVIRSTPPEPRKWKLWSGERSRTSIEYDPGGTRVTPTPAEFLTLIVKPGPTVACSVVAVLAAPPDAGRSTAAARASGSRSDGRRLLTR